MILANWVNGIRRRIYTRRKKIKETENEEERERERK